MGILTRLGIVVSSLAIGLVLSEGLVRFLDVAPDIEAMSSEIYRYSDDPRLGWEPVPRAERKVSRAGVNELGYRDVDHAVAKPPGVLRIAVIGDSIAQGTRIKDDRAIFPRVLEADLRGKGVPAEVQNFGVPGYNTQQEVETLTTRALAYSPDLVILAYCLNDRSFEAGRMPYVMATRTLRQRAVDNSSRLRWLAQSALFRYVYFGWLFRYSGTNAEISARFAGVLADTVAPSFTALAELSRAHHFRVLVAVFPLFPKRKAERFDRYGYLSEHAYVRVLSAENGFEHLDLLETFRACAKEGPVAIDVYHPNERGHRCAARTLAEQVDRLQRQS